MLAGNTYGSTAYGGIKGVGITINEAHDNFKIIGEMANQNMLGEINQAEQLGLVGLNENNLGEI